ncbi:hepatitis A virus cellular receptor 1 homolog [Mugil cephalus]|uniref:hepatitis A virus cellular receptor 1 homolog n=1 Tax=Mugil cephalus TaxID=48193 RepID=UPI001FB57FB2|nr:hepatitis A virus cellular receptor 1 homolog [Mugil cephalus]
MSTLSCWDWMLLLIITVSLCSSRVVVVPSGSDVTLTCSYDIKRHGALRVCWGRGDLPTRGCKDQLIYTDGYKVTERASSRYQLKGRLDRGDVSLTIENVSEDDSGRYGCRLMIPGPFNDEKHHTDLRVDTARSDVTTPKGSDVTMSKGSDVTMSKGSDVTPSTATVSMTTPAPEQETSVIIIGNSVKVSCIFLIIVTALTGAAVNGQST